MDNYRMEMVMDPGSGGARTVRLAMVRDISGGWVQKADVELSQQELAALRIEVLRLREGEDRRRGTADELVAAQEELKRLRSAIIRALRGAPPAVTPAADDTGWNYDMDAAPRDATNSEDPLLIATSEGVRALFYRPRDGWICPMEGEKPLGTPYAWRLAPKLPPPAHDRPLGSQDT